MYGAGLWWHRGGHAPLRRAIEVGLRPVAVGLIFAGGLRVMVADGAGPLQITAAAITTAAMLRWPNPYAALAVTAAIFGALAWSGWT